MLPLDERPCNYRYPQMMPKADYDLIMPPIDIMGDKKTPSDADAIADWLLKNVVGADAVILSLDTLIYGGIVPSRLHHMSVETLIARADLVKKIRALNPNCYLYLFQLIMRCPSYSLSDEEPDYYAECGAEIFLYGRYTHLEKLGKLTDDDKADFERVKRAIKPEYLDDFITRRNKNAEVLSHSLQFAKDGICDYFIIPQDDAAEYGFTAMDQIKVRKYLKDNSMHTVTAMYPSADDTGLTLLARAVAALNGVTPKIYVHYASVKSGFVVPWFEDRPLNETIKYHILSVGGVRVYSLDEADILLAVNMGSGMYDQTAPEYVTAYDIERNLTEFVSYIKYALSENKIVAIGDVATCNGADKELFNILYDEDLLLKIHAYAGWNTSSNTLGTTVCESVLYMIGSDGVTNRKFLLHRYYEDLCYMGFIRKVVTETVLPALGLKGTSADGTCGKVAESVRKNIIEFMAENYPLLSRYVSDVKVCMPWRRMFEADIRLNYNEQQL